MKSRIYFLAIAFFTIAAIGQLNISSPFFVASLLKPATGGGGTPTWIQDDGANFDPFNASRSVTFGSSTASGNAIVAIYSGGNATSLAVTDNKSNVYTLHVDGSVGSIAIAVAPNITGGSSHQVTFTVTTHGSPGRIIVMEVSGIATSSPFDVGAMRSEFIANISQSVTTTVNGAFLIGAMSSNTADATAGSGFTLRHTESVLQTETKVGGTAGSQIIDFTHSERNANLSVIALKPL